MVRPGGVQIRDVIVIAAGIAASFLLMAGLRTLPVSTTTVALALLLVVLVISTFGRPWTAIVVAMAATLSLNFFVLPPVGTLTIADPQNWVAMFAFLVTAVIASNLSAMARARAREAVARRNEVTRLFDLTRDVLLTTETVGAIEVLARHVARRFELPGVAICVPGDAGWRVYHGGKDEVPVDPALLDQAFTNARGTLEFDAQRRAYGGHIQFDQGDSRMIIVPLRHGTKPIGLIAAVAPALEVGTLDAVAGVVAIAIERTQFLSERAAAERVRQKADLEAALLASLSHDLKTPLTVIRVAVENLGGLLAENERATQADTATRELERLNRLFRDILDMARIDAEAIDVDRQWVTPADIVDAASAQVRHALATHVLRVDVDADTEVELDPRVASSALAHLLENAAQYSPANSEIAVEAYAGSDGLHVAVTDHGAGLDPGELDHLFERFYRGRVARQLASGTGMGLAITKGLLTAVGGRVWAENLPDAGARFTLVVPGARRPITLRT